MNVIKKYWDSVYLYILLLVPGLCMCAGTFWTVCKLVGWYPELSWAKIIGFDGSQLIYLMIAIYYIYQNKKDPLYISEHLTQVKTFIVVILFIQYNVILYLFPSFFVWEDTVIFFALIAIMFDSKLMFFNILAYSAFLLVAHVLRPGDFLPIGDPELHKVISYRILMLVCISGCFMFIVYFVERFLIQARESNEENVHLMEKQLEYYQDMELLDTEIRKFRHDIQNHFIGMESLFKSGKTEELQEYFHDLQDLFPIQQKMFYSGNDIVDAILHHELPHDCREEVKVTVYGNLPVIESVSSIDLCTLFSNLLSNAIASANACVGISEPKVVIRFSGGNKYFSITMSNSMIVQEKEKKKDRNHGYGISKIKHVVEKYEGRLEQNVKQQMMTITIYLPI